MHIYDQSTQQQQRCKPRIYVKKIQKYNREKKIKQNKRINQ